MDNPLAYKLLLYIACLKEEGFIFNYKKAQTALKEIFGDFYEISTLRKEFSNLKKKKYLDFSTYYRRNYPVLSSNGRLLTKTRLAFKPVEKWDEKWRMVVLDIPDKAKKERLDLIERLLELGFGRIQKNSFISPYRTLGLVSRYASHLGIRQYVCLAEINKLEDDAKIVHEAWDLKPINTLYSEFLKTKIEPHSPFWLARAKVLEEKFAVIYKNDPRLPEKFLPKDWKGALAYKKFKEIVNSYK